MCSAKIRAIVSVGPPLAAGTTKFMARDGYSSALTPAVVAANATSVATNSFVMHPQSAERARLARRISFAAGVSNNMFVTEHTQFSKAAEIPPQCAFANGARLLGYLPK